MNIVLVQLPHFYGAGYSRPPECYPLGLGYLSSMLISKGIRHNGIDLWGAQLSPEEAVKTIDFSQYDVIGVSSYSTQYSYLKSFTTMLKERYPEALIVCGGPGPTFSYQAILKNTGVDVCVLGEGELTFLDLLENRHDLKAVKGIAYAGNGIIKTPEREHIKDLDDLPLPNRELFDLEKIMETSHRVRMEAGDACHAKLTRSADIIAGRGCPYSCTYCSKTFDGLRLRSVEKITAEIGHLIQRYGVNHVLFNDELVLVNKKRILHLCTELGKLNIAWSCQGRVNQVDKEVLTAMKDAGCIEIGYGVESVSQKILDAMNKKIRAADIIPVLKMTREVGIKPIVQYMYGYPGEDDETISNTVTFFKQIDYPFVGFTTTPLPGTALYDDCMKKGLIVDEEEYLMKLDSGYNIDHPLVNLTDFSDEDFLRKKREMQIKITHNYLKKRPLLYVKFVAGFIKRRFKKLVNKARCS